MAGESGPFFCEVVVDELFTRSGQAVFAFFEGEECGVADEYGGVGLGEHPVEVGGEGDERDGRISPVMEEDTGVGDGCAGGGVCSYGSEGGKGLGGATDQEQRADFVLAGDCAAGEDAEGGVGSEGGDWHEADVGSSRGEAGGAV